LPRRTIDPVWCDLPIDLSISVAENSGLSHFTVAGSEVWTVFPFR
jgi:hypothetical protein